MTMILTATVNYWNSLSRTMKVIGYVGVVSGAVVSTAAAWPTIEPYVYAHRGYVRSYSAPFSDHAMIVRVQLLLDKTRRQELLDEAAKRALELQSDQAKKLPEYRQLLQDRVNRISEELKTLDEQDNSLFKERPPK